MDGRNTRRLRLLVYGSENKLIARFDVGSDWTVGEAKKAIEAATNIPSYSQIILYRAADPDPLMQTPMVDDSLLLGTIFRDWDTATQSCLCLVKMINQTLFDVPMTTQRSDGSFAILPVRLDAAATVGTVKAKIAERYGIPPRRQLISLHQPIHADPPIADLVLPLMDDYRYEAVVPVGSCLFLTQIDRGLQNSPIVLVNVSVPELKMEETFPMELEVDTVNSLRADVAASTHLKLQPWKDTFKLYFQPNPMIPEVTLLLPSDLTLSQCGINETNYHLVLVSLH